MVPVERIELPTFGLQNRCSTAELNRRIEAIGEGEISRHLVRSSAGRISDLVAKGQNLKNRFHRSRMEKAAFPVAFSMLDSHLSYWQRSRRPSSPRNQVPGMQTKPLRRAYSSPPTGEVATAAAVPAAPRPAPAATSPGQKPLLSSQRL